VSISGPRTSASREIDERSQRLPLRAVERDDADLRIDRTGRPVDLAQQGRFGLAGVGLDGAVFHHEPPVETDRIFQPDRGRCGRRKEPAVRQLHRLGDFQWQPLDVFDRLAAGRFVGFRNKPRPDLRRSVGMRGTDHHGVRVDLHRPADLLPRRVDQLHRDAGHVDHDECRLAPSRVEHDRLHLQRVVRRFGQFDLKRRPLRRLHRSADGRRDIDGGSTDAQFNFGRLPDPLAEKT
jgi:hypothetical protein